MTKMSTLTKNVKIWFPKCQIKSVLIIQNPQILLKRFKAPWILFAPLMLDIKSHLETKSGRKKSKDEKQRTEEVVVYRELGQESLNQY